MTTSTIGGKPHKVVVVEMPGCTVADAPTVVSAQLLDPDGVAYGVQQVDNKIRTSSKPFLYDIADDLVPNHAAFRRFGINSAVGATWETVGGAGLLTRLTSAERLQVISTDTDDDGAPVGAGARTLQIKGLDANYDIISETVTMNGTTQVTTDASFLRPLQAMVQTVGASGVNEGTITVKNNAASATLLSIPIGEGRSNYAIWTVPAGYTGFVVSWNGSESANKATDIGLWVRPFGKSWELYREYTLLQTSFFHQFALPLPFAEKTDIELRAISASAGKVSAGFDGWYEAT